MARASTELRKVAKYFDEEAARLLREAESLETFPDYQRAAALKQGEAQGLARAARDLRDWAHCVTPRARSSRTERT